MAIVVRRFLANPVVVLVLSILTCGAFSVGWHYVANQRLRSWGEDVRPAASALAVSWGLLVVVPWLISSATTATRVANAATRSGVKAPSVAIAMYLLPVWGYAPYLQWHLNRIGAVRLRASF